MAVAFVNEMKKSVSIGKKFVHNFQRLERVLVPGSVVDTLKKIVGKDNVLTAESGKEQYGTDESHFPNLPAVVVVSPRSTSEVAECAKVCSKYKLPMVPFGTGTGVEGGVLAVKGGVTFDMKNMDHILDLYPEDFCVNVESGVTRLALNKYLKDTGLWFPIDPGADASLGGMCATSASGTNAVQYGTMKENVLNLEVVLADGRVLHTAGEKMRAKKSSAGYNLTNLFIGSEGTLGIITKAMLKLHGIPEKIVAAVCQFSDIQSAVNTTVAVLQTGVPIARIEFLDDVMMKACCNYSQLEYEALPTLFLEFSGQKDCLVNQISTVEDICNTNGGGKFSWAEETEDRNKLWKARHNAMYAAQSLLPGGKVYVTDICVPLSKLTKTILKTKADIEKSGCIAPIVGHVGDGNFHCLFPVHPNDEEKVKKVAALAERMALRAIAAGGTCTGEHGIGLGKKEYLVKEVGDVGVDVMKQLKCVLDPDGLMNPGKVL